MITPAKYFKVIACEIVFREVCHLASRAQQVLDLEFVTQGHHDVPSSGRIDLQQRINAVPAGKYDAILLGYGLCSNIVTGLTTPHTPMVIPRGHDCITFFLGSKVRYQEYFNAHPGTYYYTSGWLECRQRRGGDLKQETAFFMPASSLPGAAKVYQEWVEKYGEEEAKYLLETMGQWSAAYSHGVLINFDFARHLRCREQVQQICAERNWQFEEVPGDLGLLERWLAGNWKPEEFLVVQPGQEVVATHDENIIGVK